MSPSQPTGPDRSAAPSATVYTLARPTLPHHMTIRSRVHTLVRSFSVEAASILVSYYETRSSLSRMYRDHATGYIASGTEEWRAGADLGDSRTSRMKLGDKRYRLERHRR